MTIHYKLMYGSRIHRFTPQIEDYSTTLQDLKEQIAKIVKEEEYLLCWNDHHSDFRLDTVDDLQAANVHAYSINRMSTRDPWVRLVVKPAGSELAAPIQKETPAVPSFINRVLAQSHYTDTRTTSTTTDPFLSAPKRVSFHPEASSTFNERAIDVIDDHYSSTYARKEGRFSVVPYTPEKLSSDFPDLSILTPSSSIIINDDALNGNVGWLLLENRANDCFLNAALQYMRRARDLTLALLDWKMPNKMDDKTQAQVYLFELLCAQGRQNPREFRECLPTVIKTLEPNFLYTQQDAYEILTKIFDDIIPEEIAKLFFIESARRRRCSNNLSCKGSVNVESGPIHYQHIGEMNQIVDLEDLLSSEWTTVEGETELRHCSACCECCKDAKEGHDEDKCGVCREDKRAYVEEQKFSFKGTSNYALVAFNILHATERVDWALSENCDMDEMNLMGEKWKAVAVIKHIGMAGENWSTGHYIAYTREKDDMWYLHDDDKRKRSIGTKYRMRHGYRYPYGSTDMEGVLAILFEKIL